MQHTSDSYDNLPLGEVKVKQLQINVNRRFSDGFTANVALSFDNVRANRTVEEYDRAPTLWQNDNNGRPFRLTGGAVYELPFGAGKPMLKEGGVAAALAGGWQLAGTFEYQPGSLLAFGNLFFTGDIDDIKKRQAGDRAATRTGRSIRRSTGSTSTASRRIGADADELPDPAFPFQIDGLAGPGADYVNMNILRNFSLGGRRRSRRAWTCRTCSTTRRTATRAPTRRTPTSGR